MKPQPLFVLLAVALLALGACTNTKTVPGPTKTVGNPAAEERADAAEAALVALRTTLALAQNALGADTTADQREEARKALTATQTALDKVNENLKEQPDGAPRRTALTALTATKAALMAVDTVLKDAETALAPGADRASLTSMHTALERARTALTAAQTSLTAALAAKPPTAIKNMLAQIQAALSVAQVSLVPQLRQDLADVQERADAEKERADAAEAALVDLRTTLALAQNALGADTTADQREEARKALTATQTALDKVNENLKEQPDGAPRRTALTALTATKAALMAVDTVLKDAETALAPGADRASLTSMHTALERARTALTAAQTSLTAALAAKPPTAIKNMLAQIQAALSAAQVSLVPQLRQDLADVQERADAEKERADIYDLRTSLTANILPARVARIGPPLSLTSKGPVTWTPRTVLEVADGVTTMAVGDPNPDKLDIHNEAVPWATGKTLGLGKGTAVSTDEFQLRGMTMRGGPMGRQNPDGTRIGGSSSDGTYNPPVQGRKDAGNWRNWNAAYESSIRMNADGGGIALKMGGDGTIFFDFERIGALGGAAALNQPAGVTCTAGSDSKCDDVIASDVTATFGKPVADPDGEAAWHFKMRVPVNPDAPHVETRDFDALPGWAKFTDDAGNTLFQVRDPNGPYEDEDEDGKFRYRVERAPIDTDLATTIGPTHPGRADWKPLETRRAQRIDRGRPSEELGVYNVWLSNYAGLDTGDDADDPSDDTQRYLDYAAYGLFNFLDYSTRGMNYARVQAFHFGYDAFGAGNEPKDFHTDDGNSVEATFNGTTTGWMIRGSLDEPGRIHDLIRLRGDVKLTATLGGGSSNGTVSGSMSNFEYLRHGIWTADTNFRFLRNDPAREDKAAVLLEAVNIEADGSFSGGVAKSTKTAGVGPDAHNYNDGTYGGAFYGPRELGELEAAGHWNLPMHTAPQAGTGALLGSFGAKSEPAP